MSSFCIRVLQAGGDTGESVSYVTMEDKSLTLGQVSPPVMLVPDAKNPAVTFLQRYTLESLSWVTMPVKCGAASF